MNGYNYSGTYNNDFGCGFTQYFYVKPNPSLGVTNVATADIKMDAYPNPAENVVNVDLTGIQQVKGTLKIIDALGREVSVTPCNDTHQQINVSSLADGVYSLLFIGATGEKLQTRLLIVK